jgi:hypothetical protein
MPLPIGIVAVFSPGSGSSGSVPDFHSFCSAL